MLTFTFTVKTFLRAFNLEMEAESLQESLYTHPMLLMKVSAKRKLL